MGEIHENNNKGWIALGPDDYTTGISQNFENKSAVNSDAVQLFNYPNPFNGSTMIVYTLEKDQRTRIIIKDLSGRDVIVRDAVHQSAGEQQVEFDGALLPEGMYILNLELESGEVFSHMMVVI
jgi:hypothetical protein